MFDNASLRSLVKGAVLGGIGFALCFSILRLLIIPIIAPDRLINTYPAISIFFVVGIVVYLLAITRLGSLIGFFLAYQQNNPMRNRYIRAGYISFFVSPGLLIWPIWGATLVFTTIFSQFVGEAGSVDVYVPGLLNAPKVCGIVFGIVIGTVFGGAYGWIAFRNMRKAIAAFFVGGVGFGLAGFFGGGIFPLFGCINFESVDWYLVWKTPLHAALFGSIGGVAFGLFSSISETFNNIESKNLRA